MRRKDPLINGQVYHIFNRSIAEYKIFNDAQDYQRMFHLINFFQMKELPCKFANFMNLKHVRQEGFLNYFNLIAQKDEKLIQLIAYCFMPTHIHLIIKQLSPSGISTFMSNILNSYTRYFNTKHRRKGPLWESKFQNVLVDKDEQLLHLTRYVHLNPVTAKLVNNPGDWIFSSFNEYTSETNEDQKICEYDELLKINPSEYKKFLKERISYQRELAILKKSTID
jgi:putative transposase